MTQEQERLIERLLQKKSGFALSPYGFRNPNGPEAAAELRRSYAECDALRAANEGRLCEGCGRHMPRYCATCSKDWQS